MDEIGNSALFTIETLVLEIPEISLLGPNSRGSSFYSNLVIG